MFRIFMRYEFIQNLQLFFNTYLVVIIKEIIVSSY